MLTLMMSSEKENYLENIYFADNYDEDYFSMRKPGIGMFQKASEEFNINQKIV